MTKTVKMRALMSLPANKGKPGCLDRKAVARGGEFDATPQEARDLRQMGQAEPVTAKAAKPEAQAK
ncbi:hypothetical protein [Vannielia litorea]|uniref:hypothetical protein n=1 Tax=Vannielia litorea TaxID=1217970 RepID=UPI001BCE3876|nr:hypothetical protein [Vannielia litorea]MBS8228409.1 hypothetical protein [Vannielia litorea]